MRIVFVGTVRFSLHCLRTLLDAGGEVVGVFTLPANEHQYNADYADLGQSANAICRRSIDRSP